MEEHVITPLYACSFELSHDEYQTRYDDLASDGYRLLLVDGYRSGNELRYGGIWIRDQASVITHARHGLTSIEYQRDSDDLRRQGYQIKGVHGISSAAGKSAVTFAAVWNDGSSRGFRSQHDMTASEYQTKLRDSNADGFQVIYVSGYASNTSSRYAAIWSEHNRSQKERHKLSPSEFQTMLDDLKGEGFKIAHVNAHQAGNQTYFAGIWIKEEGYNPAEQHKMSAAVFKDKCEQFAADDKKLICMSGYREAGKDNYAAIWVPNSRTWLVHGRAHPSLAEYDVKVESLMKAHSIPGGSLAVTRNGELVLARGYSWITDVEPPVEPTSLFRLASVTKTLTGAAIVLLTEMGELSFSNKVVNLIHMPGTITDDRIKEIKVEHLLYHVGGWNRDNKPEGSGIDPMSMDIQISDDYGISLPITRDAIIRWTNEKYTNINGRKGWLDFQPGTVNGAIYSNYGYMLLGQIIETVTGLPFEQFVQDRLLTPLGIRRMRPGRTLLRNRLPGEVLYHSSSSFRLHRNLVAEGAPENVMLQYGGGRSFETRVSNGGWVGTAVDLVRFASSFDDRDHCPILSPGSVDKLFAEHAYGSKDPDYKESEHYGCGWDIGPRGHSKGGAMEGTSSTVSRWKYDGADFCAALLVNKDDDSKEGWGLRDLIFDATENIDTWPDKGFWEDYI